MFAYIIVVAVSAFIPYVATPAAEAGVKAIVSHHNDMETNDAAVTPTLVAQVPSASDPARYALPPKHIVDVFDAEPLPQTMLRSG